MNWKWFVILTAFIGGILVALRPVIEVTRKGDGDGHVTIVINFGFVNVTPINHNDNRRLTPTEE